MNGSREGVSVDWNSSGLYNEIRKWSELVGRDMGFDPSTVEDLRQDSAILTLELLRHGRCVLVDAGRWRGFVRSVVKHTAANRRRKRSRTRHTQLDEHTLETMYSDEFSAIESREELQVAIQKLPNDERKVIKSRFVLELRYREILEQTGCSFSTVHRVTKRGLQTLRTLLA